MKDGISIIKDGLHDDKNGNFLIFVLFIIFSCIWGSFFLLNIKIDENKTTHKEDKLGQLENSKEINKIKEELAERKAYTYKNVTDRK